jgi:hypothetical protein
MLSHTEHDLANVTATEEVSVRWCFDLQWHVF